MKQKQIPANRFMAVILCMAMILSFTVFPDVTAESVSAASDDSALTIDSSAWQYNSSSDVYYQVGIEYCTDPYDTNYESLGIYVPAAYMDMTANGNGTYTFNGFTETAVGEYTAETAPIVIPVNTAGYAAQAAPTGFSSGVTTYTDEGIIYLYAGCRGRDTTNGGAPWGVTDLKAAIRYYRYNAAELPGDTDRIFTFGHSGGGAQSSVVGASGDSELYYPYLYSIGAAGVGYDETTGEYSSTISDATCGAMCWCPITSLDSADLAYEWMMGQYSSSGTRADGTWTSLLSDDMSTAFAEYINSLTLEDEDGNILSLEDTDEDGIYISGSYYTYLLETIEYSLNDFIDSYTDEDGNFSYSSSGSGGSGGGPGGDGGFTPFAVSKDASAVSDSDDALITYLESLDENFGTDDAWITYDETTGLCSIRSVEDFVLNGSKSASKDVGAFDSLDTTQAENYVFGNGSGEGAHFDSVMAGLIAENYATYAAADSSVSESDVLAYATAYQDDYDSYTTDNLLGYSSQYRQNMYNPMYYLCQDYDGYGTSQPASYWRINTGITQSDTSLTVEMNLYLALMEDIGDGTVSSVDFATHWAQGHTTAERAGADSDECFIEWIQTCMKDAESSEDAGSATEESDETEPESESGTTDESETSDDSGETGATEDSGSAQTGSTEGSAQTEGASDTGSSTGTAASAPAVGTALTLDGVSYEVSGESTASVQGAESKTAESVTVPTEITVDGYTFKVTAIAAGAFQDCTALTEITIGENITVIGEAAFKNCTALTTVYGCTGVQTIESEAFSGCRKLTRIGSKKKTVTLPKIKSIGAKAFSKCTSIKKVNLTSTALTSIGSQAFSGCTSMTGFTSKSAKLKSIGSKAFYNDKKLSRVTLSTKKLTKKNVGKNAFKKIKSSCTFKVPSAKISAYRKIFTARGAGDGITVKK